MEQLFAAGAKVRAYDPAAMAEAGHLYDGQDGLSLCEARDGTLEGADALIVVTEWNEFRSPDFLDIKARLKQPVIFDGRNQYDPRRLREKGWDYVGIGR